MPLKMTRHNGRSGKKGTYNPKHNDRRFDNSIRLQKQINFRQIKIYLGTIFRSLHKASNPGTFLHKKSEWIQIFLLHLDFFIAIQYLRYTTHNGSQLCFKYHSIQHTPQRCPLDDAFFDECTAAVSYTHLSFLPSKSAATLAALSAAK